MNNTKLSYIAIEENFYYMSSVSRYISLDYIRLIDEYYYFDLFSKHLRRELKNRFGQYKIKALLLTELAICSYYSVDVHVCMHRLCTVLDQYCIYLADADYERDDDELPF